MKAIHFFFVLCSFFLATALGCENNKPAPTPPAENITLETAVWQLTGIAAMQVPDSLPLPPTVKFLAGKIEGHGGCNGFGGNYTANGDQLTVSALMSTKMYCEVASEWENQFLKRLEKSQTYKINSEKETMEIDCGDLGKLIFRLNWKKRNG